MDLQAAEGAGSRDAPTSCDGPPDAADLSVQLAAKIDDERLLKNELRSVRDDLQGLQAEIARERLARMLRSEVNGLAAATSAESSRSGVASIIAEGATRIFSAGWAMVAYVTEDHHVRIVHGSSVPGEIVADWTDVPLATSVPICDVLRGDADRIALPDRTEFGRWPLMIAEADRAHMASLVVEPLGTRDRPDAVLAIAWPEAHELDDLEVELLELLIVCTGPAFTRSERNEIDAEIASTLQSWLLDVGAVDIDGLQVQRLYEPGRDRLSVGGDWHDVVPLSGERHAIVIGDVCGHDVRAAVEMSQVRHVLATNMHVLEDPVAALKMTDEYLCRHNPHPLATALVVVVNRDGSASLTSAGHPPPIACRPGGEARVVECGLGPPLGSGLGAYRSRSTTLDDRTVLTCYTDGLVESRTEGIDESIESLRHNIEQVLMKVAGQDADPLTAVLEALKVRVDIASRTDDAAAIITEISAPYGVGRP